MCQLWALHVVTKRQFFNIYLLKYWIVQSLCGSWASCGI